MKAALHQISIRNFKAFTAFDLKLEGRHLLLYGANGSGKSSLYWALYTFLQSAQKSTPDVSRYFDPANPQNLLNIHADPVANPGNIIFTIHDTIDGEDETYQIGIDDHETEKESSILNADLASDFITYRFVFIFSHFRNSQKFDIWPLFEREILPFCRAPVGGTSSPQKIWNSMKSGVANPFRYKGLAGKYAYDDFEKNAVTFATVLKETVDSISLEAQKFYDTHFSVGDAAKIDLRLGLTTPPAYSRDTKKLTLPVIEFGVQVGGKTVQPQTFLNEGKLTQLALSVRLAASLLKLQESDWKFLVIDDLLVSLDMNNRMKVVEILLSETFANHQKIILTHDIGFFGEFRRTVGLNHADWYFGCLEGAPSTSITCVNKKTEIQKAEEYLHGHSLDEAAVCLRKAAEDMAKRYREWAEKKKMPPGEFFTLAENLRAAKNKLLEKIPTQLYDRILYGTPEVHRDHLIPASNDDIDALPGLDPADRGKLKCQRKNLRSLLKDENWKVMENIKLIDEVLKTTERVLNPGAHGSEAPLYEHEVKKALDLIAKLEKCLS